MGAVQDREKAFQDAFNTMLGNKIGRPLKPYKNYQPSEKVRADLNKILIEGAKAQKEILAGPKRRTSASAGKKSELTPEQKSARQKQFLKDSKVTKEGNRSFFDKFKDVVGRGLNLISRPGFTVTGALYEQAKAMAEGEPFWSTLDEVAYGGWRGLSGQAQHGAGDVLREKKKGYNYKGGGIGGFINEAARIGSLPVDFLGAAATVSNQLPKGWQVNFDRAIGLIGDVGYDPLTWTGAGAVGKARNVAGATGRQAFEEGAGRVVRDAVEGAGHSRSIADDVVNAIVPRVDEVSLDIGRGAQKTKTLGRRQIIDQVPDVTGEAVRTRILEPVRTKMEQITSTMKLNRTPNQNVIRGWLHADPNFRNVYDKFVTNAQQMATHPGALDIDDALRLSLEQFSTEIAPHIDDIVDVVRSGLKSNLITAPGIKVGGKVVATSDRMGSALNRIADKIAEGPLDEMMKSLSYGRGNPGVSLGMGGVTRSELTHTFKQLFREVELRGKSVIKEDARVIQEALQDGVQLADPILEGHRVWLRQKYDEIFALEEAYGLRTSNSVVANNRRLSDYVYTNLKSNSKSTRELRDAMRKSVKQHGDYRNFTLTDLQAAGAKPETNAFNNLLARQIKANRDIAPIHFARQINEKFGIKGTLSHNEIVRRKLIPVSADSRELPPSLAASLRPGEKMYLTKESHEILKRYRTFAETGSKEHQALLHSVDYVTGKFKRLSTLYYPSFHIRNFIGDMYMGAIDGVGVRDYLKIFNKWNKRASSTISIGGTQHSFSDLVELYERNLSSSGHFLQEIGETPLFKGKRISGRVGDWAEKREDFGRFTHFTHALDEEMKHNLTKYTDPAKAWDKSVQAATYRVNKYKFDYSALTNLEQKYIKRIIPFYTYPRKALSTLAEATLISPRILSNTAHGIINWQQYADKNNPGFDPIGMPGWMRDSPFIPFGGGAAPLGMDVGGLLPMQGATDWMQNPMSNINPLFRGVSDLAYNENPFTHQDVKNPIDVVLQNLRPVNEYKRLTKDAPPVVKISNILGIPIRKATQGQQDAQINSLLFKAKGQVTKLDTRGMEQGYHVYYSERKDGIDVRIEDVNTGKVTAYQTIPEAEEALNKLLAGK